MFPPIFMADTKKKYTLGYLLWNLSSSSSYLSVNMFQGLAFSGSRFFNVQDFHGPGFSGLEHRVAYLEITYYLRRKTTQDFLLLLKAVAVYD